MAYSCPKQRNSRTKGRWRGSFRGLFVGDFICLFRCWDQIALLLGRHMQPKMNLGKAAACSSNHGQGGQRWDGSDPIRASLPHSAVENQPGTSGHSHPQHSVSAGQPARERLLLRRGRRDCVCLPHAARQGAMTGPGASRKPACSQKGLLPVSLREELWELKVLGRISHWGSLRT